MRHFNPPAKLWYWSTLAYKRKLLPVAMLLKFLNYVLFHNVLCFEANVASDISFAHFGFGCVIHPNTTISSGVRIFHHVSIGVTDTDNHSQSHIIIEPNVTIGSYAAILAPARGNIHIGRGANIGFGALVVRSVPEGATIVATPSRPVKVATSGLV